MVRVRPRPGSVIRADDIDRISARAHNAQLPDAHAVLFSSGPRSIEPKQTPVAPFELIDDLWIARSVHGTTQKAYLSARARPIHFGPQGWSAPGGAAAVVVWWFAAGDFTSGFEMPRTAGVVWAALRAELWEVIDPGSLTVRFVLRSAFDSSGEASARFIQPNGEPLESTPVSVWDPMRMFVGASGRRGYATFMSDARRFEVIQLEC